MTWVTQVEEACATPSSCRPCSVSIRAAAFLLSPRLLSGAGAASHRGWGGPRRRQQTFPPLASRR
eukprot:CAMPEP_0119521298 /NCGR_PEP_ID=MMETSP1344-20130328/37043_1 /TAXON_ID=236787 /ORGANISM="Florenciella parvula, Strain CCMP2471" /LENGTH=64 /DNA_ID=CAMNT_0007559255 /DNA_START=39 /DNA_END=231 /DNA_ORIENTATION=+